MIVEWQNGMSGHFECVLTKIYSYTTQPLL